MKRINCTHSKCLRNNTECHNQSYVSFPTPASRPGFVWPKCNSCSNDSDREIATLPLEKKEYVYFCWECFSKIPTSEILDEADA